MHFSLKFGAVLGLAALGLTGMPAAQAQVAPAVINGVFTQDDNEDKYTFDVTTPGSVILYTTSYGGGTNVDGTTTAAGGFDPILSLFDASGTYIDSNDDSPIANPDPVTGSYFDAGLQETLAAGTYQVVVTEYDNFSNFSPYAIANGLSGTNGFTEDGQGNFTANFSGDGGTNNGISFIDVNGFQRTADFTLNIGNGVLEPVPEASTTVSFGLLLALGMGGMVAAAKRKTASAS